MNSGGPVHFAKSTVGAVSVWAAIHFLVVSVAATAGTVRVGFEAQFDGQPVRFDTPAHSTDAGQAISITRLDFLLSEFALRETTGSWSASSNRFAYVSAREGGGTFALTGIPPGDYDRIRFRVGVPPVENHANPGALPAAHPLNPNFNGLHWNWQGGYVFLALEGRWGGDNGYSFHLATDPLLMTVELPISLAMQDAADLSISLDIAGIFSYPHRIVVETDTASTHSRDGDRFALQLRDNVERAFCIGPPVTRLVATALSTNPPGAPLIAAGATPHPLRFPAYFPQPALPSDNPLTEEGVELGQRLFHDIRLSAGERQSCASCHQPDAAFVDRNRRFSVGVAGRAGSRNSMPLLNLAWKSAFFWDGSAPSLRVQVLQPIENPDEMNESLSNVVAKLQAPGVSVDYPSRFAAAFGSREISADRIARALEQFLLAEVSHDSKFDRSFAGRVHLNDEERRGFELFHTEHDPRRGQFGADCFHCHGGPLFQSQGFANNGLDAVGVDTGRFVVTVREGDRGKFAVPSLRNVAVTAPYMHDGRFGTLEEVVEHYASGAKRSATLDPNLAKHPDGGVPLAADDKRALVAFLRTLTDERFAPAGHARVP